MYKSARASLWLVGSLNLWLMRAEFAWLSDLLPIVTDASLAALIIQSFVPETGAQTNAD
jgi:hypothetical protein